MPIISNRQLRHIRNSFVLQQDARDCGPACLLSIIQYYKGAGTLDNLRKLGGTNISGTSLLGLFEAARMTGFETEGCKADLSAVMMHPAPLLLHVLSEGNIQHYVAVYGYLPGKNEVRMVVGDPAKGVIFMTEQELDRIWITRACLTLVPNKSFIKQEEVNDQKKNWAFRLIREDLSLLLIAAAIGLGIAVLNMSMAVFSQRLIDDIIPAKSVARFNASLALVLLLLIIKESVNVLRQHFLLRQSKDFNNRIITGFFKNLLRLPKTFFDSRKIGELTARLNDTTRIQKLISQLAGNVVVDILLVLVSMLFLMTYSPGAGLIVLCSLPIYYLVIYRQNKGIINAQQQFMMGYALSESNYIATLLGIETVKNHNRENQFATQNQQVYSHFQEKVYTLGKFQIRLGLLANLFGIGFLGGIILYTTNEVFTGRLKTGELMAILGICGSLLPIVTNLALLTISLSEAKVAFDRMFEFINIEPETDGASSPSHNQDWEFEKLDITGLSFRFAGSRPILRNVSLSIAKGEIVAVIGENGCGKSTLLQIIQRLYPGQEGKITINEKLPFYNIPLTEWRKIIGVVPQQIHIFNGTVAENIAFEDARNRPEELSQFLDQHGFTPFLDSLPQGVFTLVGEEGINLSGGQKQIIALARAFYHKPRLLIMDEGTAAMDRDAERFVMHLLLRLKQEAGILFISHRLHVLKSFCDRIYIMEKGTMVSEGDHRQLLLAENIYSAYWKDHAL